MAGDGEDDAKSEFLPEWMHEMVVIDCGPFRKVRANRKMLEALAAIEHDRWSHWQKYLHGVCERRADGALVIPPEFVARWERQMSTPYAELSPGEQDSDRKIVAMSLDELRSAVFGRLY